MQESYKSQQIGVHSPGFSLDAYRNANKVKLYITSTGGEESKWGTDENGKNLGNVLTVGAIDTASFFEGYHVGNFNFSASIETENYADSFMNTINGLGPGMRSLIKNVSQEAGWGGISGAFDTTARPYIKGSSPVTFELKVHLPLFTGSTDEDNIKSGRGAKCFMNNILKPINGLYYVTLPSRSKNAATQFIQNVISKFKGFNDWVFKEGHAPDSAFTFVGNVFNGMTDDFTQDLYALGNPLQFANSVRIDLHIGSLFFPQVFIKGFGIDVAPMFYTDGGYNYPPHVVVSLSIQTLRKATTDSMFSFSSQQLIPDALTKYKSVVEYLTPEETKK